MGSIIHRLLIGSAALLLTPLVCAESLLCNLQRPQAPEILPSIFVHGFAGSAAQYQSQAMRFSSNGVPDELILAFEYNTSNELAVKRNGAVTSHFYFQPWPRSTFLVRMNVAAPGAASTANTNVSDRHSALVITRQKELWVNHPSGQNDSLTIETSSRSTGLQEAAEVLFPVTDNSRVAIHVHDVAATPAVSSLGLLPFFPTQPFQTGVDIFMPAATPPDGTIRIVNAHRGNTLRRDLQIINIPNWASTGDRVSVNFNDYVQNARGHSQQYTD